MPHTFRVGETARLSESFSDAEIANGCNLMLSTIRAFRASGGFVVRTCSFCDHPRLIQKVFFEHPIPNRGGNDIWIYAQYLVPVVRTAEEACTSRRPPAGIRKAIVAALPLP